MRRILLLLLSALGSLPLPASAKTFYPDRDATVPAHSGTVISVESNDPGGFWLVTMGEMWTCDMTFDCQLAMLVYPSGGIVWYSALERSGVTIGGPGEHPSLVFSSHIGRGIGVTLAAPSPPEARWSVVYRQAGGNVHGPQSLAIDAAVQTTFMLRTMSNAPNGPVHIDKTAIRSGTHLGTFGDSGPGTLSSFAHTIRMGPDGVLYVLDAGNNRIVKFDPNTGDNVGEFPLAPGTVNHPATLAVSAAGRLYTADGNGGGNMYDAATGALLGHMGSTARTPDPNPMVYSPVLTVGGNRIVLAEHDTGLHIFTEPDPENGVCGAAAGGAALPLPPESGLCAGGDATSVNVAPEQFSWSCTGAFGGTTASCAAVRAYRVDLDIGAGGSVSPSGPQSVTWNQALRVTVTPDQGETVATARGCGGHLEAGEFTTAPVIADCTVAIRFAAVTPVLTGWLPAVGLGLVGLWGVRRQRSAGAEMSHQRAG